MRVAVATMRDVIGDPLISRRLIHPIEAAGQKSSKTVPPPRCRASHGRRLVVGSTAMTRRTFWTSASIALAIAASGPLLAQTNRESNWSAGTPWGDPDLQGEWTTEGEYGVPFERPAQYGTRQF